LYKAVYDNGVEMYKILPQGPISTTCKNPPRCEPLEAAIKRFDQTVEEKNQDPDLSHIYYFAFITHAGGFNPEKPGEGQGVRKIFEHITKRVKEGVKVKFVTPSELIEEFEF
jgi:hypothetical protein